MAFFSSLLLWHHRLLDICFRMLLFFIKEFMELILVFRSVSVVLFFLSRNMMNQSLSTYKTLKWNSPMQASQWWVWPSPSAVLCLNLTVYSQFGLFSEFHIRVPLWTQRFLHKHSPDKDLQNEVWARRVGSLLFRRARRSWAARGTAHPLTFSVRFDNISYIRDWLCFQVHGRLG